ncbi:MAG: hypothetical protein JXR95_13930 [Deltaproteobacteria bacterium]|nr:hypothetical protein [Deltaproteobacteria bacterium]
MMRVMRWPLFLFLLVLATSLTCCTFDPSGPQIETENCTNGIDDDFDGFTDCEDRDCDSVCIRPENCTNGIDDDLDGFTDCEDRDCDSVCN